MWSQPDYDLSVDSLWSTESESLIFSQPAETVDTGDTQPIR